VSGAAAGIFMTSVPLYTKLIVEINARLSRGIILFLLISLIPFLMQDNINM